MITTKEIKIKKTDNLDCVRDIRGSENLELPLKSEQYSVDDESSINCDTRLTSDYIESHLKQMGLNVLRWAIVKVDQEFYTLTLAVLED